jgi:hypothetical protein
MKCSARNAATLKNVNSLWIMEKRRYDRIEG